MQIRLRNAVLAVFLLTLAIFGANLLTRVHDGGSNQGVGAPRAAMASSFGPTYSTPAVLAAQGVGTITSGTQAWVVTPPGAWTYQTTCPSPCDGSVLCVTAGGLDGGSGCWAQTTPGAHARTVRIVGIGDSHTNGHLATTLSSAVSTTENAGTWPTMGPRDYYWTGNAGAGPATGVPYPLDLGSLGTIAVVGSTDPNVGATTNIGSWMAFLPPMLRASYASIANLYAANYGIGGASAYTWSGEQASAYIAGLLAPLDGDTFTACGQVYTFRTSPAVAGDVLIGSAVASVLNLENAINGESTGWFAGTPLNASCFVPNPSATTYGHVFALSTGTGGNALTLASSNIVRVSAANGTLTPVSPTSMTGGTNTTSAWAASATNLASGPGFGTPDIVTVTLGTNDCNHPGYRGRTFQSEMQKLLTAINTSYPTTKVILWRPPQSNSGSLWTNCMTGSSGGANVLQMVANLVTANSSYVSSIDMYTPGQGATNLLILGADPHLTSYGYELTAQLFGAKIGALLGLM